MGRTIVFSLMTLITTPASSQTLTITAPEDREIVQRDRHDRGTITVHGHTTGASHVAARLVPRGDEGPATPWFDLPVQPSGRFSGDLTAPSGWYRLEARTRSATASVPHLGVGEVFLIAGQSNAANHGTARLAPRSQRVSTLGPDGWRHAVDPQPWATGMGGSPWPAMADRLVERLNVPVGLVCVARGGSKVQRWRPGSQVYYPHIQGVLKQRRYRAVLWHQGESDSLAHTSADDYAAGLRDIIDTSRRDAGQVLPWFVASVSYMPGATSVARAAVREGQRRVVDGDLLVLAGPSTDDLVGPDWRPDEVHFNARGLETHGQRWADIVLNAIEANQLDPDLRLEPIEPRSCGCTHTRAAALGFEGAFLAAFVLLGTLGRRRLEPLRRPTRPSAPAAPPASRARSSDSRSRSAP